MEEELDAVDFYEKNKKVKGRKFKNIDENITHSLHLRKTNMTVEFNDKESASIKSFAVKKRKEIKVATRFRSEKLLMFAKLSIKSFICNITETFCFPTKEIEDLYDKYFIEKAEILHILTNTDSTALQFIFISNPNSYLPEEIFRDVISEVIIMSKIYKIFDSSQ